MSGGEGVARRYARALFGVAKERNQIDAVGRDLPRVAEEFAGHRDLAAALSRPWVAGPAKQVAATDVAARLEVVPVVRDVVGLVAARGRVDLLALIVHAYNQLVDAERGRVRVRVRTAVALTPDERGSLASALARRLGGRQVMLDEVVDPSLLGGFVAEVGSLVLDGSVDAQLARIRDRLVRGEQG